MMDTAGLDGRYWYRSIRERVQFEGAVRGAESRVIGCLWSAVRIRCWLLRSRMRSLIVGRVLMRCGGAHVGAR